MSQRQEAPVSPAGPGETVQNANDPDDDTAQPTVSQTQGVGHDTIERLAAEAERMAELEREPWSLVLVQHEADAEMPRETLGIPILGLDSQRLRDELPRGPGSGVLVVGDAQRAAPKLRGAGVETVFGLHLPPGSNYLTEFIEERAKASAYFADGAVLLEVWRSWTTGAKRLEVAPTGHPDLVPKPKRQTRLRTLAEVEALPPLRWLIHGMLPAGTVGFLVAPPNAGKSTLAVDCSMRVYHGIDWHGHSVATGSVVYVAGEGVAGIGARAVAWRRSHAAEAPAGRYFEVATNLPPLSSSAGTAELRLAIEELVEKHGHAPSLVVVDTLSAHWADSEDRSEVAAPAMASLQRLAADFGLTILLLHHERKPQQNAAGGSWAALRGSGAFAGSADFVLALSGTPDALTLAVVKQRDAERASPVHLRLVRVDLGLGDDGAPRSSVVVAPADAAAAEPGDGSDAENQRAWQRAEVMVQRAVETVRAMGSATSKAAVCTRMTGKRSERYAGFDVALQRGLITNKGTATSPHFVAVPSPQERSKEGDRGPLPLTPLPSSPCEEKGPKGTDGDRGPVSRVQPEEPAGPEFPLHPKLGLARTVESRTLGPDAGRPEQPGGRRRKAVR